MTEEEKKAMLNLDKFADSVDMSGINSEEAKIVLKLIQNLQTEITEQKEINKQLTLEKIKQEMIIDEMANVISTLNTDIPTIKKQIKQIEESYCEFIKSDKDCCWKTDKNCSDCVKQYFENKFAQ